ncbi:MAG: glycoside hydrolase family 99-like domain-containing protein [Granulosicoccus sp.]
MNELSVDGHKLLVRYLTEGRFAGLSPNSVFDNHFYIKNNSDIARSDVDPFEHFHSTGWREGRNPSKNFDINFYKSVNLNGKTDINPVSHYLDTGRQNQLPTNERRRSLMGVKPDIKDIGSNIRYFSNKGPAFEEPLFNSLSQKPLVKGIAFFLPQFYSFAENNKWWGDGFTEWRNVARGTPRFEGHYQPRIPRDLGFYNLTDEYTLVRQAQMALENGLEAFCFYYYWFNGKRLMEKPLDIFAKSEDINLKFCIMWANENWTRTWDGFDNEVLIEQNYRENDEDDFIADTLAYFHNERYVTINDRPLFILYRPGLVDSAGSTIARWRAKWKDIGGVEPLILMVQGFDDMDPTVYGLDGAVEFPPHKVAKNLPNIHDRLHIIDPGYEGNVVDYNDVVNKSLSETAPDFPLLKTVSPHWDNDARREGRGFTLHGSTPANYQRWLRGTINHAIDHPFHGESFVFINAWNEWAESAYLEPDVHYGHAYLNATKRALYGISKFNQRESIALVGHDAHQHGAQMLLLNIADTFKNQFGFDIIIILKQGGPLLDQYKQHGKVYLLDADDSHSLYKTITERNCTMAITNTCVTGDVVPMLKQLDLKVISLIHELPRLIKEYKLDKHVSSIAKESDHVVCASEYVKQGFLSVADESASQLSIVPQGLYQEINGDKDAANTIRLKLGITRNHKMVLNVGFADMRKGFDLFLATAREVIQQLPDVHFVWLGGIDEELRRWTTPDLDGLLASRVHFLNFTDDVSAYFNAADCFYLSSREDPYPSVILEAFSVGCPAIIYSGATGLEKIVDQHGFIVNRNSNEQIVNALKECLYDDAPAEKEARKRLIRENYKFDEYCFSLLKLLRPDTCKVSVVIPNYNYEQYIEERLLTVFDQNYPLFEVILLEDNSPDNSLGVIQEVIATTGRKVKLVVNETNSGNTFRQWEKGLELARGDLLWIAEADDLASPGFVSELVSSFTEYTTLGFTDSRQIDSDGELLGESYDFYYKDVDADLFGKSRSMSGEEFVNRAMMVKNSILNVSSVIWQTAALRKALTAEKDSVVACKLVGDWRLYISALLSHKAQVTYLAKSLNTHRRHAASVTHILDAKKHLDEVSEIHELVRRVLEPGADQLSKMESYLLELSEQFGIHEDILSDGPRLSLARSHDQNPVAHNKDVEFLKEQKERTCDTIKDSQTS